jgi:F0F1-type ATP synthase membrane subunit b/b'
MIDGFLDAQLIVALAFFVCIGLIIKFFGKSFAGFVSSKQNEISQNIIDTENKFDLAAQKIQDIRGQEDDILKKNSILIENAKKEKEFIVDSTTKKSEALLAEAIKNQKLINKKIINETNDSFSKIPLNAAWESIKIELSKSDNYNIQKNFIDQLLDEVLDSEIKKDENN